LSPDFLLLGGSCRVGCNCAGHPGWYRMLR